MDAKFVVKDQILFHNATAEEAFKITKEYFPEISDEELNILIENQLKKTKKWWRDA